MNEPVAPPGLEKPGGALILVCCKCTRQGVFVAPNRDRGNQDAFALGWRVVGGLAFCKKCAKKWVRR